MPLPGDLTLITVTGDYSSGGGPVGGFALAGSLTFTPTVQLVDTTGNVIVPQVPVPARLTNGAFSTRLLCTDNANLSPQPWYWTVTQFVGPIAVASWNIDLPHTLGSSVDLSDLAPVYPPDTAQSTLYGVLAAPNTNVWYSGQDFQGPIEINDGQSWNGTGIANPPGGTTEFLRGDGAWAVPAGSGGGVQIGGDLGGTNSSPQVIDTHLAAPLPVLQGGTGATNLAGLLQSGNNLDDLNSPSAARSNLGLTGAATAMLPLSIADGGTGSNVQPFVDLTTSQSIGGVKNFTDEVTVPSPVNASDAVTKAYADAISSGLAVKASCQEATAAALPANAYSNGAGGIGATLTATANGALTVDGITVATGERVLVQDEVAAAHNGIYTVSATGSGSTPYVLTRSIDLDSPSQFPGAFTFVEQGSTNAAAGFVIASPGPYTVGTTAVAFTQFSGAGEILPGTGLAKSGNTISLATPVATANGGTGAASLGAAGIAQTGNNLSDLANAATARTNLGLGTAATAALANLLQVANNLSDLGNAASARGNLGLGSAALLAASAILQSANNLSDLGSVSTARTNLGLGAAALASLPLSIANGGTGSATQPFVDLSTAQNIAGAKTFTTEVSVPAPVNPSDAVTKSYADAIAQSLSIKASCQEATAAALPSNTYANGSSGVGATLTATANGALTVDGTAVSTGDRVLVKNEATAANNGIYTVTATGSAGAAYVLTRSTDLNTAAQFTGAFTFVEQGTANSGAGFVVATAGPVTVGTTSVAWTQFSGAGEISAGTGLTKSGNTLGLSTPVSTANGGTGAASLSAAGILQSGNNLSDVASAATSRTNLGLTPTATTPLANLLQAANNLSDLASLQTALNALAGAVTAGDYLRGNGTNVQMSAIQPYDLPTYWVDTPAYHGYKEWNYPLQFQPLANALASGTLYMATFEALTNSLITTVVYQASSTANSPVTGENRIGFYSLSGSNWALQGQTNDLGSWGPPNQMNPVSLNASIQLTAGQPYAVVFMANGSSGPGLRGINYTATWANGGQANTGPNYYRFSTVGTGTALPSTIATSSMTTTSSLAPWFAVY